MTVYLAFNELESVSFISNIDEVIPTTDESVALSGINRAGIECMRRENFTVHLPSSSQISEGWFHARVRGRTNDTNADSDYVFELRNSDDTPLFSVQQRSSNNDFYARVDVNSSDNFFIAREGTYDFDINFNIAEEGFVKFFVNGSLEYDFTGDTRPSSGTLEVTSFRCSATGGSSSTSRSNFFSQLILSDQNTIGSKVYTLPITEGSVNDWDGDISDVSGTGVDDSTSITAFTIDDTILFNTDNLPTLDEFESLEAVVVGVRGNFSDGSDVTSLDGIASNGTSSEFGNLNQLTEGFTGYQIISGVNPITTEPWDETAYNEQEVGLIAKA